MDNKKNIAKGLVFATTVVNAPIDSLANTIEEVKAINTEDNTKEGKTKNSIKKFFAKIVEPIEELMSEPKEIIKVNKNIVRNSVLEITLADNQFVEDLSGNPGGYETVKVMTTGDKKLVKQDYDNLRLSGIPKVDLSESKSDSVPAGAFSNATHLTEFKFPQGIISIGGASFVDGAFYKCTGLTGDLVIPGSVETIGSYAFNGCSGFAGELILPNSITSIGMYAFESCSGFTGNLVIPNSLTVIRIGAFKDCTGFNGSLSIPDSVTDIERYAFYNCKKIAGDLLIPNSVKNIGDYAFEYCTGFKGRLVLSSAIESIGEAAFRYCSGFTGNLVIPNSLTNIKNHTFNGCSGLTGDLIIPNSVSAIGVYAFASCSGFDGNLRVSNSITSIGSEAFFGCSSFTGELVIPDSVTSIGRYSFYSCSGFSSLKLGNRVETIGDYAFIYCSGFTGELVIPDSVKSINTQSFRGCNGFTSLNLGNGIEQIGSESFYQCTGFTGSLVIPNSVKSISTGGFMGCSGFTGYVIVPDTITSLNYDVFYGCSNIEKIFIKVNSSNSDTNFKENIIKYLPNSAKTVIDVPYDFDVSGTWMEATDRTVGKPAIKNIIDGVESELIDCKGESVSLYIPSLYQEYNVSVLKNGEEFALPAKNSDNKHIFTGPGIYQVTVTTDLGNISVITFEIEDSIIKDIEENLRELETVKDVDKISDTRELINSLPESILKDQFQEQLNNIFPDIELEKKTATANLDVYIKSENMLSLSLDTNSVTFEEYSGAEPIEQLGVVNLTVNSSLPYNLNAYMPTEITSSDGNNKMDIDILNIRESNEGVYKQFENNDDKVILRENCNKGNGINHSIDLKLDDSDAHVAGIYKTVIKFEAEQK